MQFQAFCITRKKEQSYLFWRSNMNWKKSSKSLLRKGIVRCYLESCWRMITIEAKELERLVSLGGQRFGLKIGAISAFPQPRPSLHQISTRCTAGGNISPPFLISSLSSSSSLSWISLPLSHSTVKQGNRERDISRHGKSVKDSTDRNFSPKIASIQSCNVFIYSLHPTQC